MTFICQQCGAGAERERANQWAKFCSPACYRAADKLRKRKDVRSSKDRRAYQLAWRKAHPESMARYAECAKGKARQWREENPGAHLPSMGDAVAAGALCSCGRGAPAPGRKRCRPCLDKGNKYDRDRSPRLCAECGVAFAPEYGNKRRTFCSKPCAVRSHKRIRRKAERARLRRLQRERVDPLKVFARDGWRCQICGKKTPKVLRGTCRPNAPELDHRIPLALGGPHTYANTQCACRACNARKGGTLVAGQMPLFVRPVTPTPRPISTGMPFGPGAWPRVRNGHKEDPGVGDAT